MLGLNNMLKIIHENVGDLTRITETSLLTRVNGGVNLIYSANNEQNTDLPDFTNRQVAIAGLIVRCLTLLMKGNTRIDAEELLRQYINQDKKIF